MIIFCAFEQMQTVIEYGKNRGVGGNVGVCGFGVRSRKGEEDKCA